jgi:hypothetical protein
VIKSLYARGVKATVWVLNTTKHYYQKKVVPNPDGYLPHTFFNIVNNVQLTERQLWIQPITLFTIEGDRVTFFGIYATKVFGEYNKLFCFQ